MFPFQQKLGGVNPGKCLYDGAWNSFAFEPAPGEGRVDSLEMPATIEFGSEFKVMKDSKCRLNNLH
jgi:hypothetical protein